MTSLLLTLKVLNEVKEDLLRVEQQLIRFRDPAVQEAYRAQVTKLQQAASDLHAHYKTILEAQK